MSTQASKDIRKLKKTVPRANREALEDLFYYWLEEFAPYHFTREAFRKYPREYSESAKRNMQEWIERHKEEIERGKKNKEARPAYESGRLEDEFLRGTHMFGKAMRQLRVKWPSLPRYARIRNKYSGFTLAEALLEINDRELQELQREFDRLLQEHLDEKGFRGRSMGRARL